MHRSLLTGLASASLLFVSIEARADEQGTPNMPPPNPPPAAAAPARPAPVPPYGTYRRHRSEPRDSWYGWQTLIADGGWMILGTGLSRADDNLGGGIALGGYLLGGPIVHWAHGNVGKGFASLGLRVGMPTVLGLGGLAIGAGTSHDSSWSQVTGAALGFSIGLVLGIGGAIAIDSAVLARERHTDDDEDGASNGQTPALHTRAPKGLFVPGSLTPILQPQRDIAGSSQITGGMIGVSAAMF